MAETPVVSVKNLNKKFTRELKRSMLYGMTDTLKSMVGVNPHPEKLRPDEFWALENINFELHQKEVLGIIGVNGSGKSTLLRVISGIYPPDTGKVTIRGRIGSLIAVGAGFHPYMTGKENIYLNGTILGMSRHEIGKKFQDIIDFAEIGDFINAPVSTYSSGMKARLGFSIAVHGTPDILLVDEVLSVGDIGFRNKSMKKMHEYRSKANALIYVSHNLDQIQYLCDQVLVLEKGKQIFLGDPQKAVRLFEQRVFTRNDLQKNFISGSINQGVRVQQVKINGKVTTNSKPTTIKQTDHLKIETTFILEKDFPHSTPHLACGNNDQLPIWLLYANEHGLKAKNYQAGTYKFEANLPPMYLREGRYYIHFAFRNTQTFETYERQVRAVSFLVVGSNKRQRDEFVLAPPAKCKIKQIK